MEECALDRKFRLLLTKIRSDLSPQNIRDLNFIYKLHLDSGLTPGQDLDGLEVLKELMARGVFDAYTPDKLKEVLESIGRKDFSDPIKKYTKSSEYKTKAKDWKKTKEVSSTPPIQLPSATLNTTTSDTVILQMTKVLQCIVESLEKMKPAEHKSDACFERMQAETIKLTKLTKSMKTPEYFEPGTIRQLQHLQGRQRERSNSLDSNFKKGKRIIDSPNLYAILPVPASAITEYHQKLGKKLATSTSSPDSESNTSSNSSIGSTKADEDTPNSDRYVAICTTPATVAQESMGGSREQEREPNQVAAPDDCQDPTTEECHVYEYPDTKPIYVNVTIPPVDFSKRPQDNDSTHYENIAPRPLTEQKQ